MSRERLLLAASVPGLWTRRLFLNRADGSLQEEVGWPWLRLMFGRQVGKLSEFDRVLRQETRLTDKDGNPRLDCVCVDISLTGRRPYLFWTDHPDNAAPTRIHAAAVALALGLPLEERPIGERAGLTPPLELLTLVKRGLRDEDDPRLVVRAGAATLVANLAPIFGVLFLGWSVQSVFALLWLELCALALFTSLRVAVGDFGRDLGAVYQGAIAVAIGAGMALVAWFAGALILAFFGAQLGSSPPGATLISGLPTFIGHNITQRGEWIAAMALFSGHVIAFALDWKSGEVRRGGRLGRMLGAAAWRFVITAIAAVLAPFAVARSVGPAAFLAALLGGRLLLDLWAQAHVRAPAWLSGRLALLHAAQAAYAKHRPDKGAAR